MMTILFKIKWWLLLPLILMLISCGSSDNDALTEYINQVKRRPGGLIEPIPAIKTTPLYRYPETLQRRNPFKPMQTAQHLDVFAPDRHRQKQPLEAFPLDSLKFVGILKQGTAIWGLISQPDGKIVRVRTGNYIGQNYGQIIRITEKAITIEERVLVEGKWEKKLTTFNLKTGE